MYKNWAGHILPGVPPMEPGETWRVTWEDGEDTLCIVSEDYALVDLDDGMVYEKFPDSWKYELVKIQFLIMEDE